MSRLSRKSFNFERQTSVGKIDEKGDEYSGERLNEKPDGHGTMFYKDGSVYVGLWQDGRYNGKGQLIVKEDKVYSGVWKDGEIIFGREDLAAKEVNS